MKKLIFVFIAFAAMSFMSCGNSAQTTTQNQDSIDTIVVDTLVTEDTICFE